jgi:hypothetical protein
MDTFLTDLAAHRVDVAATTLTLAIDSARDPKALDVCQMAALHHGHVVALYKLARNGLKWSSTGAVPSTGALAAGVVHAMILLLRVAQDVQACVTDVGRTERAWVFPVFLAKVKKWILDWPPAALPALEDVAARVQEWTDTMAAWPNPAWAAAFQVYWMSNTFLFVRPSSEDVATFERNRTLDMTRHDVAQRLQEALLTAATWETALGTTLSTLVRSTPK